MLLLASYLHIHYSRKKREHLRQCSKHWKWPDELPPLRIRRRKTLCAYLQKRPQILPKVLGSAPHILVSTSSASRLEDSEIHSWLLAGSPTIYKWPWMWSGLGKERRLLHCLSPRNVSLAGRSPLSVMSQGFVFRPIWIGTVCPMPPSSHHAWSGVQKWIPMLLS